MSVSGTTQQQLLIGGEWTDAADGRTFEVHNPYTGEVASTAAAAGREDVRRAVEAAAAAFEDWSATPLVKRREVLERAAVLMEERQAELAQIVADETGGTFGWGMFNVGLATGMLREAGVHAAAVQGRRSARTSPASACEAVRQPAGVTVGIAPGTLR